MSALGHKQTFQLADPRVSVFTDVRANALPQYPAPQQYCHATPKVLNSLPVRVEMPVLAGKNGALILI
jgi:hypothetical protein